ncbi:MAG: metallophosphoesterase, partial [Prolixibacteraceae bacterium]|nr:metallophosphoesterase [Prolixibacteraceae bacterium]
MKDFNFSNSKRWKTIFCFLFLVLTISLSGFSQVSGVQNGDATSFAVISDFGYANNTTTANIANMVNNWDPDFIVSGGDNSQGSTCNTGCYDGVVGAYYGPQATSSERIDYVSTGNFWPVPGNHDYDAPIANYLAYFSYLPPTGASSGATNLYYDFVRGPVHFFMMNSGTMSGTPPDLAAQKTFLQNALANSTAAWKIVMFHQPAYSGGMHGGDANMRWPFAEWGADFVISGHNHIYERILQDGIRYFTDGAAGSDVRTGTQIGEVYYSGAGAMRVNATETEISFEYVSVSDGLAKDTYTQSREASDDPTITTSVATLSVFASQPGEPSGQQSYTVSGVNLTGNITITAPSGFELSITNGSGFTTNPITLTQTNGTLASTPVYVRLNRSTIGTSSGNISHTSVSAVTKNVAVTGTTTEAANNSWIAYNDVSGTSTPINTTEFSLNTSSGTLLDFDTGSQTGIGVTMTTSSEIFDYSDGGEMPNPGTDAYETFNGKADMQGVIMSATSDPIDYWMDITFTGLDPTKTYTFATSINRAGTESATPEYSERFTRYTISGIQTATNASTSGVGIHDDNGHSVYFCTGVNTVNGFVARWINIQPAIDGTFTVRAEPHNKDVVRTYAFGVFMLAEEAVNEPIVTINVSLTPFSSQTGIPSAEQTYTVSGSNLTDNIEIAAPTNFEISTTNGSGFGSSLTLIQTGGSVPSTTIYVRLNTGAVGSFTENIVHTSIGTAAKNVAVSGTTSSSVSICITSRISASSDDVEQRTDNGAMDLDGDTSTKSLQMFRAYGGTSTGTLNLWGLRFPNINIPPGATINTANVTFRANATSGATASRMTFYGQLNENPATFTTSANNVSSRAKTTAAATWEVTQWTSGSDYSTPSLTEIVQEIIDQPGWAANNALVIIGEGTENQNRSADSYNSQPTLAPLFEICYTLLPAGPTITTSKVELDEFNSQSGIPSAEQTYMVSGSNLTNDIVVTAPANFEISTTSGSGFGSSLTLAQTGGLVPSTLIYVRLNNGTEGSFSGNIGHTSNGATAKNLAVSGSVITVYTLTAQGDGNGLVSFDPAGGNYNSGTVVTLTPNPSSGYQFGSWTGTNAGDLTDNSNGSWSITMNGNKTVTANFVVSLCTNVSLVTVADTRLRNSQATTNYGTETTVTVSPYTSYPQGALYKWDLSGIPDDAVIQNASVSFYVTDGSAKAFSIYNLRRAWGESAATWNTYNGTNNWGTSGAANTTSDRYNTNLWDASAGAFGTTGISTFDLNTSGIEVIQEWVSTPVNNFGLTVQNYSGGSDQDYWIVASKENTSGYTPPTLNITYCLPASEIVATIATDQTICYNDLPDELTSTITGDGDENYTLRWQSSQDNSLWTDISGAETNTYQPVALTATTYFRLVLDLEDESEVISNTVIITVNNTPVITNPGPQAACDSYALPVIAGTNLVAPAYYNNSQALSGTVITEPITSTQTVWIYDVNGTCSDEVSFAVAINAAPLADAPANVSNCGPYTLPALTNGNYYTGTGGVGPLSAGDAISSSTTLFVFTEGTAPCSNVENSFIVTITTEPLADAPANVTNCGPYTLPALTNGNYLTEINGGGTALVAGNLITSSTTLFVYTPASGSCPAVENSFDITINTPVLADAPAPVSACGSYTLLPLTNGNYFSATGGTGTPKSAGDVISSSTTLFVYAPASGSCPAVENSFDITINTPPNAPTVDITQPTVSIPTGTITVTEPTGTGMKYSINGTDYSNTNGIFTGVVPGSYTVTAKNLAGCVSPGTSVIINP